MKLTPSECLKSRDFMTSLYHPDTKLDGKLEVESRIWGTITCDLKLNREVGLPCCMVTNKCNNIHVTPKIRDDYCHYSTLNTMLRALGKELQTQGLSIKSIRLDIQNNKTYPEIKEVSYSL